MKKFLPLTVFILAIILRFYRLSELLYFMIDEDRYSFIMKRIFIDHKLILAGVAIPGGIYLGPAYFYFSGLLQLLGGFNPALMGAIASLSGVLSTVGIYFVGKKFFGHTAGLISMLIYAFSYPIVISNRIYWTLTWSSLAALTTYWGLHQIITKKKFIYLVPIIIWFILGSQSDASYFSLIILTIIFLWHYKTTSNFKVPVIISLTIFLIAQLPLLAFELRHNFPNVHRAITILQNPSPTKWTPENTLKSLLVIPKALADALFTAPPYEVTYRLSPAETALASKESDRPLVLIILAAAILACFLFYRFPKPQKLASRIISCHIWIAVFGLIIYSFIFPGYVHTWFLTIFYPAFALIMGWLGHIFVNRFGKYAVVSLLLLFSFVNIQALFKTQNLFGFKAKKQAVHYAISQVGDKPFFLNSLGSQAYGGYRYLFWLYKKEPAHSYMDAIYSNWIYPAPPVNPATNLGVVMINISPYEPESAQSLDTIRQAKSVALSSQKFAGIEVLIVPSSSSP